MKTHVVMLLDESSSMLRHRNVVVSTFNEYVNTLKEDTQRCWISLFKFAGGITYSSGNGHNLALSKVFENRKIKETYDLTSAQYSPNGWTPLYDAIGSLIKRTKARLPKDAKVLFVIHTDGQENTSKKYNMEDIKKMVQKCENKRGWTFVYLGEGAEAWNAGYDFGIDNVANFSSTMRYDSMTKLAGATACYAMNANVGGAGGSSKSFYRDAGFESADDVDPNESHTYTSVVSNSDKEAEAGKTDR